MESLLKGLYGSDSHDENAKQATDFVNRVTTGDPTEGYSQEEAAAAAQHVLQTADPATIQRAANQAMQNLSPDQQQQFGQMLQQRQMQGRLVPGQAATTGAADGPVIQRSGDGSSGAGNSGGGGIGGVLGGLLGGSGGAGGSGGGIQGMLGGLLGGLAGGSASAGSTPNAMPGAMADGGQAQAQGQGGVMDVLGGIMSSPVGKAAVAGFAAFAMKEILDRR
ncbi:MAG: hypothetical protein ACR2OO_14765 [Thermomicrobiales bacterium]